MGNNSFRDIIGGDNTALSHLNTRTATLLRNGVFVAFLYDENYEPWYEINIDPNSKNKLVAAKEEAQSRINRPLERFSILSAQDDILLKKVRDF
jgi:hypothetical protein